MRSFYQAHQGKTILIMVLAAFVLGIAAPKIFSHLIFISDTFIHLLKLCALPIILTSLIVTIGNLNQLRPFSN